MKLLASALLSAGIIILAGCATTTRFPVSQVVPAADIKAKTKLDKNNNKVITVNAKNLASPERVDPSSNAYVIWGKSVQNDVRNLGQLQNKNSATATLTTITPFDLDEIIITAEPKSDVQAPTGKEISRVELIDPFGVEANSVNKQPAAPPNDNNQPINEPDPNGGTQNEPYRTMPDTLK